MGHGSANLALVRQTAINAIEKEGSKGRCVESSGAPAGMRTTSSTHSGERVTGCVWSTQSGKWGQPGRLAHLFAELRENVTGGFQGVGCVPVPHSPWKDTHFLKLHKYV